MKRLLSLLFLALAINAHAGNRKKEIVARFEGGNPGLSRMDLYSDSTFEFINRSDIIGFTQKRRGKFERKGKAIILWTNKPFAHLRREKNRYRTAAPYRMRKGCILLYGKSEDKDAMIVDYYTLCPKSL